MNINKLNVLFLLDKTNTNLKGTAPLRCRITFQSKRKVFSTGIFLNPKYWNASKQKALPLNIENNQINTKLSLIKQQVNQAFLLLQIQKSNFEVEDIYLQYIGKPLTVDKSIINMFQEHNDKIEKLIGIEYTKSTWWKFKQSLNLVLEFLSKKHNKRDYPFKKLDLKFITDYEFYLKTERNLSLATTNKAIQRFRKIIKIAISEGIIEKDPFMNYKAKHIKKEIIFLNQEELSKVENYRFKSERLQMVADLFIFCCYTGLAFNEMAHLEKKHIVKGFDGKKWISMKREKTNKILSIPLLPKSISIMEKYTNADELYILPKISNQKFNAYLKEIADIVGVEKRLTHHLARRTFATTILLFNDVPIEIVSSLLGHSKITITQESYAKVVDKKVSEHMDLLSQKLN